MNNIKFLNSKKKTFVFAHEDTNNFIFTKYVLLLCQVIVVYEHGILIIYYNGRKITQNPH